MLWVDVCFSTSCSFICSIKIEKYRIAGSFRETIFLRISRLVLHPPVYNPQTRRNYVVVLHSKPASTKICPGISIFGAIRENFVPQNVPLYSTSSYH